MNRNGIALLVLIFSVLCLSVFAMISYASARSDKRAAQTGAELFQSYYEADAKAEEELDRLIADGGLPGRLEELALPVRDGTELYVKAALYEDHYDVLEWRIRGTDGTESVGDGSIKTGLPDWLTE